MSSNTLNQVTEEKMNVFDTAIFMAEHKITPDFLKHIGKARTIKVDDLDLVNHETYKKDY